jgi:broad specificity phosphatase PhoE
MSGWMFVTAFFLGVITATVVPLILYHFFAQQFWGWWVPTYLRELERYNKARRPRRIILIRHGESEANVDSTVYARVPDSQIPLTERGKQQAATAGEQIANMIGNERVTFYVSPFLRTKQTAAELAKYYPKESLRMIEEPRIREQEWGNLQDPTIMKIALKERQTVGRFFYRFHGGESGADVYDRASGFLETLFRHFEHKDCAKNVIVVTHGLFVRLFLMRYYRFSIVEFERLANLGNCEFVVMEMSPASGGFELKSKLRTEDA